MAEQIKKGNNVPKENNDNGLSTEQLLKMINELRETVKKLSGESVETAVKAVKNTKSKKNIEIEEENNLPLTGDDDITVESLCLGEFTLSTLGFGNGKSYTFGGFGYERDIPYSDLKECIHANRGFIEGGRIYIKDKRVVKKFRLQEFYDKMLTSKDILNLKNLSAKDLYKTLISLPKAETSSINSGNEPKQFDIAYRYIMSRIPLDEFSVEQIAQVESAYKKVNNKTINIMEEIDFANEVKNENKE